MRLTKDDKRKQESDKANLTPGGPDADLGLAPVAGVQPVEAELVDATEVVKLASRAINVGQTHLAAFTLINSPGARLGVLLVSGLVLLSLS